MLTSSQSTFYFGTLALLLPLSGCGAAAYDDYLDALDEATLSDTSTDSESSSGTSGTGDSFGSLTITAPNTTVITDSASGGTDSGTGGTDTEGDTEGEAVEAEILEVILTPDPILYNGPILVSVVTENVASVSLEFGAMLVQGETVLELEEVGAGIFEGKISILTGLDSGQHSALVVPRNQDDVEGEPVEVSYTVSFEAGSEAFWEVYQEEGPGQVSSIAVLPDGDVFEFGMSGNGNSRCYLRRRSKGGAWKGVLKVLPGVECKAIDIEVGDDGTIDLLLSRYTNGGWVWWLAEMPAWGADLETVSFGGKGEVAYALAEYDGMLAVCGSAPTLEKKDLTDVMVKVYRPDLAGQSKTFDYWPLGNEPHRFDEVARGCSFTGRSSLLLVGDAYGWHDDQKIFRNRSFDLYYDLTENKGEFRVADAGFVTQSFATDVDVSPTGWAVISGYLCSDNCKQSEGYLQVLDGEGKLTWETSTGVHALPAFASHAVRWSPANYIVLASGGIDGSVTPFLLRAYAPGDSEPLWTYSREDFNVLNLALTLAIGTFGEVYAGGWGESGFPVFVIVHG